MTTAADIIGFISTLHGMDYLKRINGSNAPDGAFDHVTGQVIEPAPDFPEGDMLLMGHLDGQRVLVQTHTLMEALLVRTAHAWSITQGGSARDQYIQLTHHLAHKTGFGT